MNNGSVCAFSAADVEVEEEAEDDQHLNPKQTKKMNVEYDYKRDPNEDFYGLLGCDRSSSVDQVFQTFIQCHSLYYCINILDMCRVQSQSQRNASR